ncbi:MAG: enoyl-CoA hydratase/isomerase family protein [Hyphomonadaceae bacterium]|nr:enoyl-CoA hydratase/isomerase family protein [Hyphomonadaceae bacterium]
MSEEHIIVRRDGAVLEIQFNRPEKKNAITNAMYGVMADAVTEAETSDGIRAVLFSSVGDFFSAGNDIKDFAAQSAGAFEGPRHVGRFLEVVVQAEKPVIAAVQGHAVGVGTTMLFQCDLVYVADDARLTVPFIDLGVVPENASSMTMVDRLGHTRAFALFGLGEPLMGKDAATWGLANAALPSGEVLPRGRAAAQMIASKPPQSIRLTKKLMRDREALLARMREEGELFAERLRSPEAAAAFAAFLTKR